jgi:hypothetical protein
MSTHCYALFLPYTADSFAFPGVGRLALRRVGALRESVNNTLSDGL